MIPKGAQGSNQYRTNPSSGGTPTAARSQVAAVVAHGSSDGDLDDDEWVAVLRAEQAAAGFGWEPPDGIRWGVTAAEVSTETDPAVLIRHLTCTNPVQVAVEAAQNPHCPPSVVNTVAVSTITEFPRSVRQAAWANPNVSPEIMMRVVQSADGGVAWSAVASNPNCSPDVLRVAVEQHHALYSKVLRHPNLPVEVLTSIIDDPNSDSAARANAAANPSLPDLLVTELVHDHDPAVRLAVVGHHPVPVQDLRWLARDESAAVRATVAAHFDVPQDLVPRFAADSDAVVREALAHNPMCPQWVLRDLAEEDVDHKVVAAAHVTLSEVYG